MIVLTGCRFQLQRLFPLLLLLLFFASAAAAAEPARKRVLFLRPNDYSFRWGTTVATDLIRNFGTMAAKNSVELEIIDLSYREDGTFDDSRLQGRKLDFDMVLTDGFDMTLFAARHPEFADKRSTTIIAYNVPASALPMLPEISNLTGCFFDSDLRDNVRLGFTLKPRASEVLVLYDNIDYRGNARDLLTELKGINRKAKFILVNIGPGGDRELLTQAGRLHAHESFVVLQGRANTRYKGEMFTRERNTALHHVYSGLILSPFTTGLGNGVAGGMIFQPELYAVAVSRFAEKNLSSETILPPERFAPTPTFDVDRLTRLGIVTERLPGGAQLINQTSGPWYSNQRVATIMGILVLSLVLLLGGLLYFACRYLFSLRRSEREAKRYGKLFSVIPGRLMVVDGFGKILLLHGEKFEHLKGTPRTIPEIYSLDYADELIDRIHQVIQSSDSDSLEVREGDSWRRLMIRKADRSLFNTEAALLISFDVTHQIELNQKLVQLNTEQQRILDVIPISVVIHDRNRNVILLNQAARNDLHNASAPQLCFKGTCVYSDRGNNCPVEQVLQKRTGLTVEYHNEEQDRDFYCYAAPLFNSAGEVDKVALATLDITELSRARARLDDALRKANSANRAKSMFLATMSHEIRTPLNAIIALSELMLGNRNLPHETTENLRTIHISGQALLRLINDILDYSKLEADKQVINYEWCDVNTIFDEIGRMFAPMAQKKNIEFGVFVPERIPEVNFNLMRLRQVLLNLVGNAIKFTAAGHVYVKVFFTPAATGEALDLAVLVEDTGPGIPEEDQKTIFNPFEQARSQTRPSSNEGTGLGLSIAKQLTEKMNGALTLISAPGRGSSFNLHFRSIAFRRATALPAANAKAPEIEVPPIDGTILIVDDVETNCKVLSMILKTLKIRNEYLTSPAAALEKLRNHPEERPVLVLSDMWMPEYNGDQFLDAIRLIPGCEKLPVVAVTADTEAEKRFNLTLFSAVLLKPITVSKLKYILARLFGDKPENVPLFPSDK